MSKIYLFIPVIILLAFSFCSTKNPGCQDPMANNTDPSATENDGSCDYDSAWVTPLKTMKISEVIDESSGLIWWDGILWTHNDNDDTKLYGLDPDNAEIVGEYNLPGVVNTDWEEISQDGDYIYLGDMGNNASGNRSDLHILRIEKVSLKSANPVIDTIWFSYSDQIDLSPSPPNQTEFDCEAFVVSQDSIYLFTKQWNSAYTSLYSMSNLPGEYVAKKIGTLNVNGLITGASFIESSNLLVLCGYNSILSPFLILLYDYPAFQFFSGNKRKINLSLVLSQVEGIATQDGLIYYISNETFVVQNLTDSPSAVHIVDLTEFLEEYLELVLQ